MGTNGHHCVENHDLILKLLKNIIMGAIIGIYPHICVHFANVKPKHKGRKKVVGLVEIASPMEVVGLMEVCWLYGEVFVG